MAQIPPFVDTHVHLHYVIDRIPRYKRLLSASSETPYADAVNLMRADQFGPNFESCVNVLCDADFFIDADNPKAAWRQFVNHTDFIYLSVGLHPFSAPLFTPQVEAGLIQILSHPRCVALGEIGLDYHYPGTESADSELRKTQHRLFRRQLEIFLAHSGITDPPPSAPPPKALVIHIRQADDDALQIMQEMLPQTTRIHSHCFTGPVPSALAFLDAFPALCIGVTGAVTHVSGEGLRMQDVARAVPIERLLIETDAPYLPPKSAPAAAGAAATPAPQKQPKKQAGPPSMKGSSHPGQIPVVAQKVAELKGMDVADVMRITRENARRIYGI